MGKDKETTMHDDRITAATSGGMTPGSLVGSYFHTFKDGAVDQQGCVVGEPLPGIYLVEHFSWFGGESTNQRLASVREMQDWTFYDDADWMNAHYENVLAPRKNALRDKEEGEDQQAEIIWRVLQEVPGKAYSRRDLAQITGMTESVVTKVTQRMQQMHDAGTAYRELVVPNGRAGIHLYGFRPSVA